MPASMPTASRPDSAQCDPVSRPMDSVQCATDRPSTPTPTAPTAHAKPARASSPCGRARACGLGFAGRPLGRAVDGLGALDYAQSRHGNPPIQGSCVESGPRVSSTRPARLFASETSALIPRPSKRGCFRAVLRAVFSLVSRPVSGLFRPVFPLFPGGFLGPRVPRGEHGATPAGPVRRNLNHTTRLAATGPIGLCWLHRDRRVGSRRSGEWAGLSRWVLGWPAHVNPGRHSVSPAPAAGELHRSPARITYQPRCVGPLLPNPSCQLASVVGTEAVWDRLSRRPHRPRCGGLGAGDRG